MIDRFLPEQRELPKPQVIFRPKTAEEEARYVLRLLANAEFYEKSGYDPVLPEGEDFLSLVKEIEGRYKTSEPRAIEVFKDRIYRPENYQQAMEKLEEKREIITECVFELNKQLSKKSYRIFQNYNVQVTLYGPGGSYIAETGDVIIRADINGNFKRKNPAHTAVHEIVHIGIEHFVTEFLLTHWQKEGMVDGIIQRFLKEQLPDYEALDSRGEHMAKAVREGSYTSFYTFLENYTGHRSHLEIDFI